MYGCQLNLDKTVKFSESVEPIQAYSADIMEPPESMDRDVWKSFVEALQKRSLTSSCSVVLFAVKT